MSNLIRLTTEERLVLATLHGACAQAATHARSSLLTRLAVVLDELERGDVDDAREALESVARLAAEKTWR